MAIFDRLFGWLRGTKDTKRCPRCKAIIPREFTTCPNCSADVPQQS